MKAPEIDVLIVGAGISGLMAAQDLVEGGFRVLVIDKGQSAGGRLATRRIGRGRADHGAQFFTARSVEFQVVVNRWLIEHRVYEWSRGWSDGSLLTASTDGYPRYAVRGGFNALAEHLRHGLDFQPQTRLSTVMRVGDGWEAISEDGRKWQSAAIVLTAPVPQSLALLDAGHVALPMVERGLLERLHYSPCLCGLFDMDGEVYLPEPGALQRPNESISWIADNRRKGLSPEALTLTVHAGQAASVEKWNAGDHAILSWMKEELRPLLSRSSRVRESRLERWRYASPLDIFPARCFFSGLSAPLVFAGDAFDGPRVEGAVLSGWAAAEAILSRFQFRG